MEVAFQEIYQAHLPDIKLGSIEKPALSCSPLFQAAANNTAIGDNLLQRAIQDAPLQVSRILAHMPPQPEKEGRIDTVFSTLDSALRKS